MMLRLIAIAVLTLSLQACAMVGSNKPLFSAPDTRDGPQLRAGLWAMPDEDCKDFDPIKPAAAWPKCANLVKVTADTIGGVEQQDDGSMKAVALTYVLAAGDPRVLQLAAPADKKPTDPNFLYLGLRPTRLDDKGRAVEVKAWMALCEKPDSKALLQKHTPHPLPGLTPTADGKGCLATSPGPVREAVKVSEGWLKDGENGDAIIAIHWVRDGDR
jgi:hypothetical protein